MHLERRGRSRGCDTRVTSVTESESVSSLIRSIHQPQRSRPMFSVQKARPFVFTAVASAAVTLGVVFAYVSPAASNVNPASFADRSGVASYSVLRPWSENLSGDAVDAGG